MIDYKNKKRFYTSGSEFTTLTCSNYIGYVFCLSGRAFADQTNIPLIPESTFETNVYISPYLKNRDINETLSLPYSSSDVMFGANDFLTKELFLDKLGKLHDNNTFVYSKMFIANNDLPALTYPGTEIDNYSYACLDNSNSTSFKCVTGTVTSIPFKLSNRTEFREIGNIRRFASKLKDDTPSDYTIFAITSSGFTTLTGNKNTCSIIEQHSQFIESSENSLVFGSLFDITLTNNFIFITDEKNNVIYKYDIGGYYNGDLALANKRNLLEILGGDGPKEAKNLFKAPKHITSNKDIIVINDSGNRVIKIFDLDFNFITRISSIPQSREPIVALKINEFYNTLYVFTKARGTTNRLNLYIFNLDCFRLEETYKNIDVPLQLTEEVLNIEFSKNNSDYYYVCTDRQVYKLFVSKPNTLIGKYQELNLDYITGTKSVTPEDKTDTSTTITVPDNQWYKVDKFFRDSSWKWGGSRPSIVNTTTTTTTTNTTTQGENITIFNDVYKGISFLPTSNNYDSVVFITDGRIYFFNEPNTFKQVVKITNMYKFGKANMSLSSDEYIQASTINKELYKVARDILILKNNLVGRFTGNYDKDNILTLTDYNYNVDYNVFSLLQPEDYYVHENEKSMVEVINRAIKNILFLQQKLLELTGVDRSITVKKELSIVPNRGTLQIS